MIPKQPRKFSLCNFCHSYAKCTFSFYLGKKVAFVYRAHREVRGTKIRVIWGKVTRPHGMFAIGLQLQWPLVYGTLIIGVQETRV